jgi:ankyrin repeat protein
VHPSICRLLLQHGASPDHINSFGWNAIFCLWSSTAYSEGRSDCFKLLFEEQTCGINHVTSDQWSLIHRAAVSGTANDVAMLHQYGADATVLQNALGWNALHYATLSDSSDVLTELTKEVYGLDINEGDFRGWTPLHLAAFFGTESAAITLLRLGADPHLRTKATTFRVSDALRKKSATPAEVAEARDSSYYQTYLNALRKSGVAVYIDEGGDIYWDFA